MRSPSRNKPLIVSPRSGRLQPKTPILRGLQPVPIQSLVRKNVFYYDFCQIKWAKIIHYLLESTHCP